MKLQLTESRPSQGKELAPVRASGETSSTKLQGADPAKDAEQALLRAGQGENRIVYNTNAHL